MVYSLEAPTMSARTGSANAFSDLGGASTGSGRRHRRKRSKKALFLQDGNMQGSTSAPYLPKKTKEARTFEGPLLPKGQTAQVLDSFAYPGFQTQEENIPPVKFELIPNPLLTPLLAECIERLADQQFLCHPKTDFLFRINAACEDKVDAALRDEAIFNLRFLHKINNLSPQSFADAVNITDRFIVKVKVKPKYMACVATAAYFIATKMNEDVQDQLPADRLVTMARCGGTAKDLERMEAIIRSKLWDGAPAVTRGSAVTPLSFLQAMEPLFASESDFQLAVGELETCLCSVSVYQFSPAQMALAIAAKFLPSGNPARLAKLMELCEVTEKELDNCQDELHKVILKVPNRSPSPRTLSWNLSRRTLTSLQKPLTASLGALLYPIHEDLLEEDPWEWEISRLFD